MNKTYIRFAVTNFVFFTALSANANAQSLDQVLFESSEYLRAGQPREALELLSQHQDAYAGEQEFLNNLAIAYLGNNQPEKALSLIRELVDNDPLFSIIAHNYLELELGATGAKTDRVNPILFVQTVDSFTQGVPVPQPNQTASRPNQPSPQPSQQPVPQPNQELAVKPEEKPREALSQEQVLLEDALRSIVQSWASAWSDKDFNRYIAHYGPQYEPRHEQSFEDWHSERRTRLAKPGKIQVTITNLKIISSPWSPRIQFDQIYESDNYSDKTRKEMSFSQDGSLWKIRSEKTISAY